MLSTPDNLIEFELEFAYEKNIQAPFTVVQLEKEAETNAPLLSFNLDTHKNIGGIKGPGENGSTMVFVPKTVNLFSNSLHQVCDGKLFVLISDRGLIIGFHHR